MLRSVQKTKKQTKKQTKTSTNNSITSRIASRITYTALATRVPEHRPPASTPISPCYHANTRRRHNQPLAQKRSGWVTKACFGQQSRTATKTMLTAYHHQSTPARPRHKALTVPIHSDRARVRSDDSCSLESVADDKNQNKPVAKITP